MVTVDKKAIIGICSLLIILLLISGASAYVTEYSQRTNSILFKNGETKNVTLRSYLASPHDENVIMFINRMSYSGTGLLTSRIIIDCQNGNTTINPRNDGILGDSCLRSPLNPEDFANCWEDVGTEAVVFPLAAGNDSIYARYPDEGSNMSSYEQCSITVTGADLILGFAGTATGNEELCIQENQFYSCAFANYEDPNMAKILSTANTAAFGLFALVDTLLIIAAFIILIFVLIIVIEAWRFIIKGGMA